MEDTSSSMNYLVKAVTAEDDYILLIDFADGQRKRFDMKPIIARGGVFDRLKNKDYFKKAHVDRDTVSWDEVLDIAPESLYDRGVVVVR